MKRKGLDIWEANKQKDEIGFLIYFKVKRYHLTQIHKV